MSDRLWLGSKRNPGAEVNLVDCKNIENAIACLLMFPGPFRVFGTSNKIKECQTVWQRLFDEWKAWEPIDRVSWEDTGDSPYS